MAQSKGSSNGSAGRSRSTSSSGKTGPPPQILLIELKQRILAALNRLADRDTQQIAVEDLERIAETLPPEGISVCLCCLYDTDAQQKSAVRKECVKMFGTLAALHEDLLAPHLSKMITNIVRRLRDPDSSIRDACVETMGTLAAKVFPTSSSGEGGAAFAGPLGVFAKPLFDAMSEQNRGVQVGAAMSLARVIDCFSDPSPGALQRLCPRIIKFLNSPTFTAKAALLSVVASIVQAGGATSHQCLATLVACLEDCLKCNDWATRKASSETLSCMASNIAPSLGAFKLSVIEALESCRFDKVKPVRDVVVQTLQVWKRIPTPESVPDRTSAVKENTFIENQDCYLPGRKAEGFVDGAAVLKSASQVNSTYQFLDGSFGLGHARSAVNKLPGSIQKKRAPLIDKRANPDFFQKVDKKDSGDWQIDIAVPRALGGSVQQASEVDVLNSQSSVVSKERKKFLDHSSFCRSSLDGNVDTADRQELIGPLSRQPGEPLGGSMPTSGIVIENQVFEENVGMSSTKGRRSRPKVTKPDSCLDPALQHEEGDVGAWALGVGLVSSSSSSTTCGQGANSGNDLASIQRQLFQIENQQSNLLEQLQKFMNSSHESLLGLEVRMAGVESAVSNLVQDLASGRCNGNSVRCCGKFLAGDFLSSKFWKKNENRGYSQDRCLSSESTSVARGGRDSPLRNLEAGIIDDVKSVSPACIPSMGDQFLETQANSWRVHVDVSSDSVQRRTRNEAEGNQYMSKKFQQRGAGSSLKSTWRPSKDEATLSAVRVMGEDGRLKFSETVKAPVGLNRSTLELRQDPGSHKIGGQGKGPFWSLWTRAAEFLCAGDVDSAYAEVLCAGDELLLVRLMSRTGPVLEQLSSGTSNELLQTVVQLLLQQTFLDVIVPWIQQVAELVTNSGTECLGLTLNAKRELVASLEEASTFEYPEAWIAKTLDELALYLGTTWDLIETMGLQKSLTN